MQLTVYNYPFEFMQFTENSEVTLVLLPTFVDVVFYDETSEEAPGCNVVCPTLRVARASDQPHLPV